RRRNDFDGRARDKRPHAPDRYTPLNLTPSQVLMEIRGKEYLRWPRPLHSDLRSRDRNKYCRYHRDHGHDTDDCRELKNEIEALIRRDHLDRFIAQEPWQRPG